MARFPEDRCPPTVPPPQSPPAAGPICVCYVKSEQRIIFFFWGRRSGTRPGRGRGSTRKAAPSARAAPGCCDPHPNEGRPVTGPLPRLEAGQRGGARGGEGGGAGHFPGSRGSAYQNAPIPSELHLAQEHVDTSLTHEKQCATGWHHVIKVRLMLSTFPALDGAANASPADGAGGGEGLHQTALCAGRFCHSELSGCGGRAAPGAAP